MRIISHRGNLFGPNESTENFSKQVDFVLSLGLDCEIDVWFVKGNMFLGHDSPQEVVTLEWLIFRKSKLWIHCKNVEALDYLASKSPELNFFWHQADDYSLTSQGYIWAYPGKPPSSLSVSVLPELYTEISREYLDLVERNFFGICSDYAGKLL